MPSLRQEREADYLAPGPWWVGPGQSSRLELTMDPFISTFVLVPKGTQLPHLAPRENTGHFLISEDAEVGSRKG